MKAEWICAKFTVKTCLVTRSYKFECPSHRSNVKVTGDKKRAVHSHHPPAATEWNELSENNFMQQQQTEPFCWCQGGGAISAACVRFIFGKTSLALVLILFSVLVKRLAGKSSKEHLRNDLFCVQ